jgi:hypothetical protein
LAELALLGDRGPTLRPIAATVRRGMAQQAQKLQSLCVPMTRAGGDVPVRPLSRVPCSQLPCLCRRRSSLVILLLERRARRGTATLPGHLLRGRRKTTRPRRRPRLGPSPLPRCPPCRACLCVSWKSSPRLCCRTLAWSLCVSRPHRAGKSAGVGARLGDVSGWSPNGRSMPSPRYAAWCCRICSLLQPLVFDLAKCSQYSRKGRCLYVSTFVVQASQESFWGLSTGSF